MQKLTKKVYKDYLKSDGWKERRKLFLQTKDNRCERCESIMRLNVHHGSYQTFGKESDEHLFILCKTCHNELHKDFKIYKKKKGLFGLLNFTKAFIQCEQMPYAKKKPKRKVDKATLKLHKQKKKEYYDNLYPERNAKINNAVKYKKPLIVLN